MSSSVTVVGGVNNGSVSGAVQVPVTGLTGSALANLQSSLGAFATSIIGGTAGFTNVDSVAGTTFGSTVSGTNNLFELTNTDSVGATTAGTISGSIGISSVYSAVVVQAPGAVTINGSGVSTEYVLGSSTIVDLNTNGGNNTIVGVTSSDTINATSGNSSISYSSGSNKSVTDTGNNTIVATGSASVVAVVAKGYAGTINFTNNSSKAAEVVAQAGSATVFGGNAGGTFLGGSAGSNLLVGGSGAAFLVGGGNNDTLEAGGGGATTTNGANYLFAGSGNETLLASSVTGTNLFAVGVGTDVISTAGSGTQYFFGSSGTASITGSTTTGANNIYFFGSTTAQSGNDIISNFGKNSELIATNGINIESISSITTNGSPGALVTLSDGTHITLTSVSAASIQGAVGGNVIA